MSQVAPAERSPSMTTCATSLRNSTGRSKRASRCDFAWKSNDARPTPALGRRARATPGGRRRASERASRRSQGARVIVDAGQRVRAPDRRSRLRPSGATDASRAKGARPAQFHPIGDPQEFGLRRPGEEAPDRRQRPARDRARQGTGASERRAPRCPPCRAARPPGRLARGGCIATATGACRIRRASRARSIGFSQGAAAPPSSIRIRSGPDPGAQRDCSRAAGHREDDERADGEAQRQDRPWHARRRGLVRIEPEETGASGGNTAWRGLGGVTRNRR